VGYKKTKELIWVTTAAIILILIILAVIKVCNVVVYGKMDKAGRNT
jgi:hypothetical protein